MVVRRRPVDGVHGGDVAGALEVLQGYRTGATRRPLAAPPLSPGSAMLVGGDPGIGKSTLLLQVAARLASEGKRVIYVSGEESAEQVRLRAVRLGLGRAPVQLAAATSVRDILTTVGNGEPPALLIIDSIQTMHSDLIEGAPGTVSQVRASA